jgi:hypothetical protein
MRIIIKEIKLKIQAKAAGDRALILSAMPTGRHFLRTPQWIRSPLRRTSSHS